MSDLGAIFHIKKAGVQYDAHAYTTLDECPYPNLKWEYKGQQAFVKMAQGKGNGDVPCYAKDKAGVIYQVKKEEVAVPTGSVSVGDGDTFSVPPGVKVIRVFVNKYEYDDTSLSTYTYVGVTPGKKYKLECYTFIVWVDSSPEDAIKEGIYLGSISGDELQPWFQRYPTEEIQDTYSLRHVTLSWSPEINNMQPTYTDY